MNANLLHLFHAAWSTCAALLVLAAMLSIIPRLGKTGWHLSAALCHAPLLDAIVASFTWLPWVVAASIAGWAGFAGAVVGEFATLGIWCLAHELAFREA